MPRFKHEWNDYNCSFIIGSDISGARVLSSTTLDLRAHLHGHDLSADRNDLSTQTVMTRVQTEILKRT
jgi:hypothetical protein